MIDVTYGCASVTKQGSSSSIPSNCIMALQIQCSTDIQDLTNASTTSQRSNPLSSIDLLSDDMKMVKITLDVRELKEFQVQCINAVM